MNSTPFLAVAAIVSALVAVSNESPAKISGCAIRLTKTPYAHQNESHSCAGVTGVEYDSVGRVVISFDGGCVRTVITAPDETMVAKGLSAGPSGGGGSVKITLARDGSRISAHNTYVHGDNTNLWFLAVNETSGACAGLGG